MIQIKDITIRCLDDDLIVWKFCFSMKNYHLGKDTNELHFNLFKGQKCVLSSTDYQWPLKLEEYQQLIEPYKD